MMQQWTFHLYSIWLFTFSDIKTIIIPSTISALVNALSVSLNHHNHHDGISPSNNTLSIPQPEQTFQSHFPSPNNIILKTPLILLWVWLNLLPFAIANQRQPAAIAEDAINKPWRTMPSKRLSPLAARRIMLSFYLSAIIASAFLNNLPQCLLLILLGTWYNDFHGADWSCVIKNFINGCGFICFSSGAMQIAISSGSGLSYGSTNITTNVTINNTTPIPPPSKSALDHFGWWYLLIALIVFTTVQSQDIPDQAGDRARGRNTVPLVIGDNAARWSLSIPMLFWAWLLPAAWDSSVIGYAGPAVLGTVVAARTLEVRSEEGDKKTFRLWNLWLVSVYALPLVKAVEERVGRGW